ncbi:fatty-acid amide hydrolase 2 [Drosophila grimshawi]|uniref:GH18979 n=1 Tax=Drosophila grimshawi TaxID=7222 RepID=B4JHK7_DROGR|nr:fatty-acid amide hydrolase 2 [Drosophila grimshawi]EDV92834.1 GH18979 [Drosophila grimshawi]
MSACKMLLEALLVLVHIISDRLLELVFGWYLGAHKRVATPANADQRAMLAKSAVELATQIRERKLKSYDIVKAYCDRIESVNGDLNAIVDGPFADALQQASEIDQKLADNKYSKEQLDALPFLGVPFTTKDSTSVAGRRHTLGLVSRKNERAKEDAECVRLMRASGAIIIATSNVPEVNKWMESRNMLIGRTNNPYDLRRSVGGSSGGEACLISACCTGFGLGTDIGGSIRIPAFNCGIFGHKPSEGAISMAGCTFRTGKEQNTMVCAGPMTRYATDLRPLMQVLLEPSKAKMLQLQEPVDLSKLRYFYAPNNRMRQCNPIQRETEQVLHKVRKHFEDLTGQQVRQAELPATELTGKMWRYWMTQEPANFNKLLGNGADLNPFVELFKKLLGQSDFSMAAIYSLLDSLLPKESETLMREATEKCKSYLQQLLGDNGVLFYHSSPRTAPFHYYPLLKFMDFSYFSLFNVLRLPVTQVPMGLDAKGMPLGIQVVANHNKDRLCLAVAEQLERTFGGWVAPFPLRQ